MAGHSAVGGHSEPCLYHVVQSVGLSHSPGS